MPWRSRAPAESWHYTIGLDTERTIPALPGVDDVLEVVAGEHASCLLHRDDTVSCWGFNENGELGAEPYHPLPPAQPIPLSAAPEAIAMGPDSACARMADGMTCWGAGEQGQLGTKPYATRCWPAHVTALPKLDKWVAGSDYWLGITPSGALWQWGLRTPLAPDRDEATPRRVDGLASVLDVAVGADCACVVPQGGSVQCWETPSFQRSLVCPGAQRARRVSRLALGSRHGCAVLDSGRVVCWGDNGKWQLGRLGPSKSAAPLSVVGPRQVVAIAAASSQTCALETGGRLWCWGVDVGLWRETDLRRPHQVLEDAVAVTAGAHHFCAVRRGGELLCWGSDLWGQLGNGMPLEYAMKPTVVAGIGPVRQIAAAGDKTCAIDQTDALRCWGRSISGELGPYAAAAYHEEPIRLEWSAGAFRAKVGER